MAETGHRAIDDAGIDLPQDVVAQAQLLHGARAVVLNDNVRLLYQFLEHLLAVGVLEIQGTTQLATVEVGVVDAVIVDEGPHLPGIVAALGVLQLNDRRAHISQHQAAVGTSQNTGQVEYDHAVQKTFVHQKHLIILFIVHKGKMFVWQQYRALPGSQNAVQPQQTAQNCQYQQ